MKYILFLLSFFFLPSLFAQSPTLSLAAGFYASSQQITLSGCPTIRYTTNGDEVKATATLYSAPFSVLKTTVVRARCFQDTTALAKSVTQTYFINEQFTLPVVSLATDYKGMFDDNTGIYASGNISDCNFLPYPCANYWQGWERGAHIEFFESDKKLAFKQPVGIKVEGGWTKANPKKSLRIMFDDKQFGAEKLNYALFSNEKPNVSIFKNIVLRNGGNSFSDALFRDAFTQRLMKNEHTDYMAYRPTHLFINGEYWGIHELREREEKSYLRQNGSINDKDSIDMLRFNDDSYAFPYVKVINGSDSAFFALYNEVKEKNPMNFPVYYDFLQKRFDLPNYIDYFATRIFINDNDWVGIWTNNIKVWRPVRPDAVWRYMLWDTDFGLGGVGDSFNGQVNYNKLHYTRHPTASNEHSDMFDYMLLNVPFCFSFINRFADLMNTTFQPKNMKSIAYAMRDELQPDIKQDFDRWKQNDVSQWKDQVDALLDYGEARVGYCRQHILSEFNLPKTVEITLDVVPKGAGKIHISTITAPELPWTGVYFDGVPVTIEVIPEAGYKFAYWEKFPLLTAPSNARLENIMVNQNTPFVAHLNLINANDELENAASSISIFPNPTKDFLMIKAEKNIQTVEILSMDGKKLLQQQPNSMTFNVDVRTLTAGSYWIWMDGVVKRFDKIN
ncbi:MAG: hypothetical protein RLZZ292_2768 [Bacteroidota bacterium]|jgi:hypothetical protein